MTYQPTDEHLHALAAEWLDDGQLDHADDRTFWSGEFRALLASDAGQSIIRAAQAEAWGEGVTHSFQTIEAPIAYDAAIFADNPYREAPTA